jgi:alkylation response protein AidB-like acyl-CoA dehydrogenase
MDFDLPESHRAVRDRARAFADTVLRPVVAGLDAERRFPVEHLPLLAAEGFLSVHWPREHGGAGLDTLAYALVLEELARVSPAHAIAVSVHVSLVGVPLLEFGTPGQKAAWLPRMARGEVLGAFALTEAEAGSDASAVRTTARREADGSWVLNGEKVMVTNGGPAGLVLAFATVDPARGAKGLTAFLVPADGPGVTRGPRDRLMGLHPADVRSLHFENVRVPAEAMLGAEGHGMKVALAAVNVGRIGVAAQATGIAAEMVDRAVAWARSRRQFGQEIARFGAIHEMLADMAVERDVARLLTQEAAAVRDRGEEFAHLAARAKWTASEAAVHAADRAIQVHGGWGYLEAVGIERYARDARVTTLYEGTSEMQKLLVARHAVTRGGSEVDWSLSDDQQQIRAMLRDLCREEFAPQAAAWDHDTIYPEAALAHLAELGFFGLLVPEEYGGVAYDPVSYAITLEELARVSAALSIMISVHNSVGCWPIARYGTEEQKRRFLPMLVGGKLAAFSLSEPGAGSDAGALACSARRDGDHYVLNGTKNWVTNGAHAAVIVLFARTDPDPAAGNKGISAFLVTPDLPGFSVGKHEDKMGLRASVTVELGLQDCRVPAENRLGQEGEGFRIAMSTLDGGRIGVGAQSLGIAAAAFAEAIAYAQVRETFGRKLFEHQPVAFMLAEMERRIAGARALMMRAAWKRGRGEPHRIEASMAKLYASEAATFVTHRAIQVHGGYGYVKEYPVERYYRDARVTEIYEGASEIQRMVIARELVSQAQAAEAAATRTLATP